MNKFLLNEEIISHIDFSSKIHADTSCFSYMDELTA